MTRGEAIQILKYNSNVIHKTINGETDPNEVEALDMAISALEHPERNVVVIVPCGDAISRQEAIDTIRQLYMDLRAEIVELTKCPYGTECLGANCPSNTDCMICGDHVLEIIDKYKAGK